jgi:hypothetical protein
LPEVERTQIRTPGHVLSFDDAARRSSYINRFDIIDLDQSLGCDSVVGGIGLSQR